jgi:outer membrane protein TolC
VVQETVIDTYFNLLRAKLLLRVAEEGERVAREQLDRTRALYELGSAARADVLKSQVQLDNTRLTLVKAQQFVRQSQVDLEWAMNLESPTPFEIDTTLLALPMKTTTFEAERDYALVHRQNLLAYREGELGADRRVWVARGSLLPTVDFRYSLGYDKTSSAYRFGAATNSSRQWAVVANWNLWDRYLNYAQIGQAKANLRIANYERRQAELDAIREVRRLVNSMDEARERLDVSRQSVASAQEDLRLAQERFRVGAGTILDTITAESNLTSARANEVQARVDYLIARASLARATGRPLTEV